MLNHRLTLPLFAPRVYLRDWREADLSAYARWMAPHNRWHELDGPYYPLPTADEINDLVTRARDSIRFNRWPTPRRRLPIIDRDTEALLGQVTWYWQSRETDWLSLGIALFDPQRWRQGLGYEALGLWCEYLWAAMPTIVRLDLRTWSGNTGMMRLAEKVGFVQEACFRQARIVRGKYFDGLAYGILRTEWSARYPQGFADQWS